MTEQLLLDTAEKAFGDTCTFEAVQRSHTDDWAPEVWDAAAAIGLPWLGIAEADGGVGGTLTDAIAVARIAGRHAAPIPLTETALLAGWALAAAGLPVGDGPLTVVPGTVPGEAADELRIEGGRLHGVALRVPWARQADRIVAIVDRQVVAVRPDEATIEPVTNVAGEPRDTVRFDGAALDAVAPTPDHVTPDDLRFRGALTRAALIAGALEAMAELTVAYAKDRTQFGKPIFTFQAVQAHLVTATEEAALVDLAVQVAAHAAERGPARFEIAAAKSVADQAALVATRAAHQAHGAIGMTQEYRLHHLSRRLWAWRAEYGSVGWNDRLGRAVEAHGADGLYQVIADGSASGISL